MNARHRRNRGGREKEVVVRNRWEEEKEKEKEEKEEEEEEGEEKKKEILSCNLYIGCSSRRSFSRGHSRGLKWSNKKIEVYKYI